MCLFKWQLYENVRKYQMYSSLHFEMLFNEEWPDHSFRCNCQSHCNVNFVKKTYKKISGLCDPHLWMLMYLPKCWSRSTIKLYFLFYWALLPLTRSSYVQFYTQREPEYRKLYSDTITASSKLGASDIYFPPAYQHCSSPIHCTVCNSSLSQIKILQDMERNVDPNLESNKIPNITKILRCEPNILCDQTEGRTDGRTDGQTFYTAKLIVAFHNFENTIKYVTFIHLILVVNQCAIQQIHSLNPLWDLMYFT